jgi:muramoyltetrapeptide carboxypeptidase LdcA involved in peptidoglycan recycling
MLAPPLLSPGDTLMAVSHSWGGPGAIPHRYAAGKRQLEAEFGVRVREATHALRDEAWLARNPQARAHDLMEAFSDPTVTGVISTIGGDDAIRLIPYVDLEVIRANPKPFIGFSDATVVHLMCHRAGVVSFYGPSMMTGFAENLGMHRYTADSVRRTLFSPAPVGRVDPSTEGWTDEYLDWTVHENAARRRQLRPAMPWRFLQGTGRARGPLFGGCLEVLQWLRGTSLWPDAIALHGAVLFLETSEEGAPPRALTRELRTYASMGLLQNFSAILFGRPGGRIAPDRFAAYDDAILKVVRAEQGLSLPVVTRMDFGHTDPMFVIPYGVTLEVDCDRRTISIPEAAVSQCQVTGNTVG